MSNIKLKTPSGGSVQVTPTDTTSDYTVTLPATTGTIALTSDIPTGTVTLTGTQTLTNKTLTTPAISTPVMSGVFHVAGAGDISTNEALGTGALTSNTTGYQNTAVGGQALNSNSVGYYNTAVGYQALRYNSGNSSNTAVGWNSLTANVEGPYNTALGALAVAGNVNGSYNTGLGYAALYTHTSGNYNTVVGGQAFTQITTGAGNTVIGYNAGNGLINGSDNTIIGANAIVLDLINSNIVLANGTGAVKAQHDGTNWTLTGNVTATGTMSGTDTVTLTGTQTLTNKTLTAPVINSGVTITGSILSHGGNAIASNTAIGSQAFDSNIGGTGSTAVGTSALTANDYGNNNTAVGTSALAANLNGSLNTAVGYNTIPAISAGDYNTAIGGGANQNLIAGAFNTVVGANAAGGLQTGSGNTVIGAYATVADLTTNNIILANGTGAVKAQHDGTNWTLTGNVTATGTMSGTDTVTLTGTQTLTNKTLALGSNTISGTLAQFNTAVTDADLASLAGTETLTNKTLTSPAINGGVIDTTSTTATAALGTSSTRLANTAFVQQEKEYLPALSQSLHIGAVVKAIVYDTSKDSDGGAWRMRCADKSWYTETLGGDRWIGQHATIAAAWAAAGSTTGAVYQASATAGSQTSGLYYTPTSSTTVTQVYRGVTREFPAVAGIVAESARVVIYDLATGAMWMVLGAGVSTSTSWIYGSTVSSVAALNGIMAFGTSDISGGLQITSFIADNGTWRNAANTYRSGTNIANRNASGINSPIATGVIVNRQVNDIAITVLDSSPIDPATGLPVPTIAVATAGGVSVIKDDGTVVNSTSTGSVRTVCIDAQQKLWMNDASNFAREYAPIGTLGAGFADIKQYYDTSIPATLGSVSSSAKVGAAGASNVISTGSGLTRLKSNPATPTKGMVAYVTTAYNSGWLPGDIRGAYLADTTAETVTASGELVTNGTFDTDTSGWTASQLTGSVATIAVASARLRVTNNAATGRGVAYQTVTTVIGRTYVFSAVGYDGTSGAGNSSVRVGTSIGGFDNTSGGFTDGVQLNLSFTATATTTYITLNNIVATANLYVEFDNISVKLAEPDRSVKNKGLVINGSLTKTAVASGAGLVAWSGFSAANYLEQPYNSDLDFGTGDFAVMGWVNTPSANTGMIFDRGSAAAPRLALYGDGTYWAYICHATGSSTVTAATASTGLHFICLIRLAGVVYLYVDGTLVHSVANTQTITNVLAPLSIGVNYVHSAPCVGSLALWRISATAPSADQIAHIYRTELPLFQASAQCTIAGSSTAVTALAYDDTTELLHVGTSWGRTGFKDLLRVDSEATTTGALTSLSASQGVIITGGTSGKVYVPAMLLRDELRRKDEAKRALGRVPVFFDHTATASQTAFVAPKGYTIKAVYHNGTLKRETTTGVYWTRSSDGFAETCTLSAGATVSDWISLMCVRQG